MEKIKSYENTQLSDNTVEFQPIAGLNTDSLDYKLLKNKPLSVVQSFAMDIWSSAWSAWDWTYRDINLIWLNGDRETSYSQEIIVWLGSTTAKITRQGTIMPTWNTFIVNPWKVFSINSYFSSATQNLRVSITWSKRYLKWWVTDLNSTATDLIFINSGTTPNVITLKFATTAAERPIFWFLIEIK